MLYENLDFPAALRFLAEKAGVTLQSSAESRAYKEYAVLYELHDVAAQFYSTHLASDARALHYARERGLSDTTRERFMIGYAPAGGENLTLHFLNRGYDIVDVVRAGLAHKNTHGLYRDRFNDRLMFPLFNSVGKIVAFTGRLVPGGNEQYDRELPKYINSPETPLFSKSKLLYGFHTAKHAIAQSKKALLVEGQMDTVMCVQAGIPNCVAVSGTALTSHHVTQLRRLADTVVISFDNDEAGMRALERSLDIFLPFDFHLHALSLGSYKDPAEAAQADPAFLLKAFETTRPALSILFSHYFDRARGDTDRVLAVKRSLHACLAHVKKLATAMEQQLWLKELASLSGIAENALTIELLRLGASAPHASPASPSGAPLASDVPVTRLDRIAARLVMLAFTHNAFWDMLKTHRAWFPIHYHAVFDDPESEPAHLLSLRSSYELSDSAEEQEREFGILMKHLELEYLKGEQGRLQEVIRDADRVRNESTLTTALEKFRAVSYRIQELISS